MSKIQPTANKGKGRRVSAYLKAMRSRHKAAGVKKVIIQKHARAK